MPVNPPLCSLIAALFLLAFCHLRLSAAPALLPAGFLSGRGSQLVSSEGVPVRIASVGVAGMGVVGGRLELVGPFGGLDGHMAAIKSMGFNCLRVDWINKTLDDPGAMAQFDELVAACRKIGLKVIFDNHNNEATPGWVYRR